MDNLEKLWCHSVTTDEELCGKSISCSYAEDIACFITENNFLCTYQHHKLKSIGAAQKMVGNGKLKRLHYLSFYDTIFAATDFDFYVFGRHTFRLQVYYVTHNIIVQLAWNPMETALVVIFENDNIIMYNYTGCNFVVKQKSDLHVPVPNSVYVGWGSHNTQFQAPHSQESTKDIVRIEMTNQPPKISWTNDGEQFVVNYYKEGKRYIKIFDKELNPLYMSDEYINLGSPVSFMPSGQCIASCAVQNGVNIIVIFEQNCQVRSTFEVPENEGEIRKLEYHAHMNMLAVYSRDNQKCSYINIYLSMNSKWHLKHQLFFPQTRRVREFQWVNMPDAAYTICKLVVFTSKNIEYHTFRFIINRCPRTSITAVINGAVVEFYNYADKIIPPPMKLGSIGFSRPVNQILFHPKLLFAIVLNSRLQASLVDISNFARLFETADLQLPSIACFHHIDWIESTKFVVYLGCNSSEELISMKQMSGLILEVKTFEIKDPQYVLTYNDTESLESFMVLSDQFCAWFYLSKKILTVNNIYVELYFALSSNQDLYVNETIVSRGITSLLVFQNYVLFTSVDSQLYCIRLFEDHNMLLQELDLTGINSRCVEQGSRIVTCVGGNLPQVILQAPRGNIETVQCKLIAVDVVENFLNQNDWKAAIDVIRVEKINWNVLIDLNPQRFVLHIEDFVKAAVHCSILSSIVTEFGNTNNCNNNCLPNPTRALADKRDIIVKILDYLITTNGASNLLAIVAIQQKHVSLKSALYSIKDVFDVARDECYELCEKALQYLLLKNHFKDVISAGYTFFDLDFLTFIYTHSTEDPKVYKPEIADLRELDFIELRFKMNLKANNPKNAFKYLLRCDYRADYVELFVIEHKLEAFAYHITPSCYRFYNSIATLYAKYLSQQRRHSEAAFVLSKVRLFSQALEEHRKALNWMDVVVIMNTLKYDEVDKQDVLEDLSEQLVRKGRVDDAVLLLEHYIEDYPKAIQVLVDHKAFKKAIECAKIHDVPNIIEQLVLPNLATYMSSLNESVGDYRGIFEKQFQRLKVVRQEKQNLFNAEPLAIYERNDADSDSDSTYSGSSQRSSTSRGSTTSSRNRRKEEKKKTNLRQGGYYEDIALIRALHILYRDVFSLGPEVRDVCLIVEHGNLKLSRTIHEGLSQLQEDMKKAIDEIWPDVFINIPQTVDNSILAIIYNKPDLDLKYHSPPPEELLSTKWNLELYSPTF